MADAVMMGGHHRDRRAVVVGVGVIGIYGGYFGAGAGVMILALLLWATTEPLPRANAVKNVVLGVANGVAALIFVSAGEVRWSAVVPLGAGPGREARGRSRSHRAAPRALPARATAPRE
jgi:uncharacterized membrane protein YfcA